MKSTTLFVVLIFASALVGTAALTTAHDTVTGPDPVRVFDAADSDPNADQRATVAHLAVRDLTGRDADLRALARTYDFTYRSLTAPTPIGEDRRTLTAVRRQRVSAVTRTGQHSRWPATAPTPTDGSFLRDVTVSVVGVEDGGRARAPGTPMNGTYLVPASSTVYSLADHRVSLPDRACEYDFVNLSRGLDHILDKRKHCLSFTVANTTTTRTLSVGDQSWQYDGDDRFLDYANLTASGQTPLRVEYTVALTVEATVETYDYNHTREEWVKIGTTTQTLEEHVTATDSREAVATSTQRLHVHQTVVEQADGRHRLVLEFQGPESLVERRLWSHARIGDSHVLTGPWRAYSRTKYARAWTTSNANPARQSTQLPDLLGVELVPTGEVSVRERADAPVSTANPTVEHVETTHVGDTAPSLHDHVNVSVSDPTVVRRVVVRHAPAPVSNIQDLHGESIPLTTETIPYREPDLRIQRVNATHARLSLTDPVTGDPLARERLYLTGSDRQSVRTGQSGTAVVPVEGRLLAVEYRGTTGDEAVGDVYYGRTSATSLVTATGATIVAQVTTDLQTVLTSGWAPFVVALAILTVVFRHRQ